MAFYNFPLHVLQFAVRDNPPLTPEQAVWRCTGEIADWFGIDAGKLRVGDRADIAVIDPDALAQADLEVYAEAPFEELGGLMRIVNRNDAVVQGDLSDYVPLPTGFDPLDGLIGGGLRSTELVLLGGAQGIGKTICTLQIARNVARRGDYYSFYLSYEHTETHLMNRLLCLESISPPDIDLAGGLKLKDLEP
jgi:hypothetical protein